jgi:hypothetical protein
MSSQAEPPLLHVLPYLLPLLVADGSAAAVALTCSSLRRLVHAQQQRLDLSSLSRHDDPGQAAGLAADAGKHFPACTAVKCGVLQDSDFLLVQNILPALARQVRPPSRTHAHMHACIFRLVGTWQKYLQQPPHPLCLR